MTEHDGHMAGWEGYRALGLVSNPFRLPPKKHAEAPPIRLMTRAAGLKMLAGVEGALQSERPRPVRVLKPSNVPSYYPRSAMTTAMRELGAESETGVLPIYVQLIMMRKGRIRGTLSALAEVLVARSIDTTIARYAARAFAEPDRLLPEWEVVQEFDITDLIAGFEAEPEATTAAVFGPPVDVRESVEGGIAEVMRTSGMRQSHQPPDPAEDEDTSEDSALEKLAEMTSESEGAEAEEPLEEEVEAESEEEFAARRAAAVAAYVIAHAKKHVSPVLARGMRSYVESGTAAMSQELKITKAPRKTLGALARFARLTFRSVVIIYDGFETWAEIPDDLRALIVSGLAEVRLALGQNGVIVIAGSDVEAPEIDDQFANAIRVEWAMPEIERVQEAEVPFDAELLATWLEAAAIPGADLGPLRERVERACANAEDMAAGAALAADEIEKAAAEGVRA